MFGFLRSNPADAPIKAMGRKRSGHWGEVRDTFILLNPKCAACGSTKKLNCHHVRPFHLFPSLELEASNLITLCEGPVVNCHLNYGHLRDWSSYNVTVREDAATWLKKIKERP